MPKRHIKGRDFTLVHKTGQFYAIKNARTYPSGSDIWVCNSSDFFHNDADGWRSEIWEMIKSRPDLRFLIVTKRIERYTQSLPSDWNGGYDHVWICCTTEDQENADKRLSLFNDLPAKHKMIMVEPMFSKVDLSTYLSTGKYVQVVSGGECCMSRNCRLTRWSDVTYLYDQCKKYNITFVFERTGTRWVGEEQTDQNKYTFIMRQGKQVEEAERASLNYWSGNPDCFHLPIKYSGEYVCKK